MKRKGESMDESASPATKFRTVPAEGDLVFKILLPNSAAGAVIGKGGEKIAKLQDDHGVKMLVSKAHDTYPGTSERVCRLTGPSEGILEALSFIINVGYDKIGDHHASRDVYDNSKFDRNQEMKMLVPERCAGLVIGKAGDGIKEIKQASGAHVGVSSKEVDPELPERVVTFCGEKAQLLVAAGLILERIQGDANASSVTDVTYTHWKAVSKQEALKMNGGQRRDLGDGLGFGAGGLMGFGSQRGGYVGGYQRNLSAEPEVYSHVPASVLQAATSDSLVSFLANLGPYLKASGYSSLAINHITQAMQILARYNVLGLGLGFGTAAIPKLRKDAPEDGIDHTLQKIAQEVNFRDFSENPSFEGSATTSILGASGSRTLLAGNASAGAPSNFKQGNAEDYSLDLFGPLSSGNGGAVSAYGVPSKGSCSEEIQVVDNMVGVILGRAGTTLAELMDASGTKMFVSRKGDSGVPPDMRKIEINGSAQAVARAKLMIEHRLANEKQRRERRDAMAS